MTDGQVRVTRYFDVLDLYRPHAYAAKPEAEICAAIDRRLDHAVGLRAGTSGPVGIALSGGVDSGYIAQKLVHGGATVLGYNLAYEGHYDEFKRIDRLADLLGITVRKISLAADEILENYTAASAACSEPVGFNNATMRFAALAAQKDGVRTLFDGDGADRLFLGMNRYLLYRKLLRAYGLLDKAGAAGLAARLLGHVPHPEAKKLAIHFRNWSAGIPPYPERTMGATDGYRRAHERAVYRVAVERFAERFPDAAGKAGEGDFGPFFALVSIQMCPEMFFHEPAEIQAPLGLCPAPAYWDDDLVSLAISLPTGWKLKDGKTKYILRQAAAANVDPQYWMLPKIGLQDSFSFVMRSDAGRAWRAARREEVRDSAEYGLLRSALPGGRVEADRLIGLVVWRAEQG
ncbi:MAG: asparagine synthase [Proteobacteria bacterium]|nr:asparagine synthase [Pseudomonadota bacterium]